VADRAGQWRIRAFSEDGHGVDVVTTAQSDSPPPRKDAGQWLRIVDGVSILFGIFGILALLVTRRRAA
jgi:nickel transport protein